MCGQCPGKVCVRYTISDKPEKSRSARAGAFRRGAVAVSSGEATVADQAWPDRTHFRCRSPFTDQFCALFLCQHTLSRPCLRLASPLPAHTARLRCDLEPAQFPQIATLQEPYLAYLWPFLLATPKNWFFDTQNSQ